MTLDDIIAWFNSGATPQTQQMTGSGMDFGQLLGAYSNPQAVMSSVPAQYAGSLLGPVIKFPGKMNIPGYSVQELAPTSELLKQFLPEGKVLSMETIKKLQELMARQGAKE